MKNQHKVLTAELYHETHDDGREWSRLRIRFEGGRTIVATAEGFVTQEHFAGTIEKKLREMAVYTPLF